MLHSTKCIINEPKTLNHEREGSFLQRKKGSTRKHTSPADPSISPKAIRGIIVGIILLIVLTQIGFSKRYIQFFPEFDGFTAAQHFHGMMMMGWLLMLLVQPILILKGKTKLHRRIGTPELCVGPIGITVHVFSHPVPL